jgi:hypothetical protein
MIAALALALTAASGPELTVAIEPSEARVGDRVTAILAVAPPPEATGAPRFPEWQGAWGSAEVLASSPPVEDDGVWRQRLVLTLFSTGDHVLPPVTVEVPTPSGPQRATPRRAPTVRVRSVLAPGQTELEPAAPPRPLPLGEAFAWTAGALAAAIAAAALLVFWRRRARTTAEVEALLPPLEQLRRSLAALCGRADPEAAWVGLSLALRRYLGARLGFPAAESTTSEIQRSLLREAFPADLAGTLVRLLRAADQVKFARELADTAGVERHLATALELAERVEALLRPAAPEAEAA